MRFGGRHLDTNVQITSSKSKKSKKGFRHTSRARSQSLLSIATAFVINGQEDQSDNSTDNKEEQGP
jgi:hypothetical protein